MEKIDVKALTVGFGVSWAILILLTGLAAALFGWGLEFVSLLSSLYIGFEPTILGSIIGAVWGFIDGAIAGAIIAFVYNKVSRKKGGK